MWFLELLFGDMDIGDNVVCHVCQNHGVIREGCSWHHRKWHGVKIYVCSRRCMEKFNIMIG